MTKEFKPRIDLFYEYNKELKQLELLATGQLPDGDVVKVSKAIPLKELQEFN